MASYNRVILVGNLTRDPELRYIPSGTAVSEIGLAVNDRVKKEGQWTDETTFVDVTLWARTAEIANEYLSKGSNILIEGRLKFDSWENNEGQKRSKLRVVADRMQMLGGREGGRQGGHQEGGHQEGGHQEGGHQEGGREGTAAGETAAVGSPDGGPQPPKEDEIPF